MFKKLIENIHLNDNSAAAERGSPNFDILYKIRPFIDRLNEVFKEQAKPGSRFSIDECMVKFKGRSSIKQYMPKKPIKRGYKIWAKCEAITGYLYQFIIYTGKTEGIENDGLGYKVVTELCQDIPHKPLVVFDNFFTSCKLLEDLYAKQLIEMGLLLILIWPLIISTVNGGWFDNLFRKREIEQEVSNALEDNRNARFLSLFTYVQLLNPECITADGSYGTCLGASDCAQRRGTVSGPCARGYGVCCVFMATCGQTIRENGTYFVNNEYPNQYDGTGSCQLSLIKSSPDVCQFRLNFEELNLMQPESVNHICDNDQFLVSGGNPVPVICGNNMGNHMYVSTPPGIISPLTLSVVTSGPSYQRNWKIRVLQIPCGAPYKAGEGCLQYFTGVAGQILSYNYDPETGAQLSNQDYSICIRPEWNFCGIQYTQCPNADPANPRNLSFTLSGNSNNRVPSMVGSTGTSNFCQSDYLIIPVASNVGRATANPTATVDRICGGVLAADISSTPTTVRSTVKPFQLYFHADGMEAPNDVDNKGFCLNYIQVPCASAFT
ncbi:uncharacterized protein [Diabrotica undecimpunctata]|uniref:uncharacterized protein n=1 Tax=Diabrotica undecimpunctata TaxID=50387 RepID=UPI003B63CFE0